MKVSIPFRELSFCIHLKKAGIELPMVHGFNPFQGIKFLHPQVVEVIAHQDSLFQSLSGN